MVQLQLNEGDMINCTNTTLPLGTFIKVQPQHVDFLEITDPKAMYV